jgi:nucleotide-binding universal stress UspA family protein
VEHRETETDAQHLVDAAVAELQGEGVDARGQVLPGQGRVGRKILEVAEEERADLIVLGSRSMSRLEEIVAGNPSHKVVHAAKCPVLLVR